MQDNIYNLQKKKNRDFVFSFISSNENKCSSFLLLLINNLFLAVVQLKGSIEILFKMV